MNTKGAVVASGFIYESCPWWTNTSLYNVQMVEKKKEIFTKLLLLLLIFDV